MEEQRLTHLPQAPVLGSHKGDGSRRLGRGSNCSPATWAGGSQRPCASLAPLAHKSYKLCSEMPRCIFSSTGFAPSFSIQFAADSCHFHGAARAMQPDIPANESMLWKVYLHVFSYCAYQNFDKPSSHADSNLGHFCQDFLGIL